MVGGDVRDHGDVVAVVAEALAQDAPRATSNTAVSTVGFWSTIWADFGPDMSPRFMSRPSTTMPSVDVIPTRRPISLRMWAIIRTVVVLPLVPVTATIGIRAGVPGGNSRSMTGFATYCG